MAEVGTSTDAADALRLRQLDEAVADLTDTFDSFGGRLLHLTDSIEERVARAVAAAVAKLADYLTRELKILMADVAEKALTAAAGSSAALSSLLHTASGAPAAALDKAAAAEKGTPAAGAADPGSSAADEKARSVAQALAHIKMALGNEAEKLASVTVRQLVLPGAADGFSVSTAAVAEGAANSHQLLMKTLSRLASGAH